MKNAVFSKCRLVGVFVLFICFFSVSPATAAEFPTSPSVNKNAKWRIGFYQGGDYPIYYHSLKSTVEGLMEIGWIEKEPVPDVGDGSDAQALWRWLSENIDSEYLVFKKNAFWSAQWKTDIRKKNKEHCYQRLNNNEVDLMIGMGTWAGKDLATNRHSVPVIIGGAADPISAGIVKSLENSGFEHVIAHCDPTRYIRQLKLFHSIFKFKNLGVVYDNTESGRTYASIEDIEKVSRQHGFNIVTCQAADENVSKKEAAEQVLECHEKIAPKIDALWIHSHLGYSPEFFPDILKPVFENKVYTWARQGEERVKRGVLMAIAKGDYKERGVWYAETMAKILNGASPQQLDQEFRDPQRISLNLETADIIGYTVPPNLKKVASGMYHRIEDCSFCP